MTAPTIDLAGQAIPQPPDFPVSFAPGEEGLFWERDRMHFPQQLATLEGEFIAHAIGHGFRYAFERYHVPLEDLRVHVFNGHLYQAMVPSHAAPEELEAQGRRSEAAMIEAIGALRERWENEWLPEIERHLRAMEAADPRSAPSLVALVDTLEDHWARSERLWELHFEVVLPAYIAMSEFDELYRDLFDGEGFDAYRLLHGHPSRTLEVGMDLFRLSRLALDSPAVVRVLETEAAAEVPARLEAIPEGRAFLTELQRHLAAYGHRAETWGLATPTFIEDPSPVVNMLKDYMGRPDAADPARELERLSAEREAAIAEARERLQGYPAPVVGQFEALLEAAQVGMVLSEDHGFYIDAWSVSLVRELLSEMGARLVEAGLLDDADDVLMLTYDDLRVAALDLAEIDARALVAARRAELAEYAGVTPPPAMGTPPAGPPPDSPLTRFAMKFFNSRPAPSTEPDVVNGAAGSPGRVTGVARVVRSLSEASALQAGEVLVAEMTAPPWTPLFAVAAAIVTDTGGILSHSAVVAREYGIPAVVGATTATAAISDGDLVEVDGDAGVVRIVR